MFIILRHITYIMGSTPFLSNGTFFFTQGLPIAFTMFVQVSEREFSTPNYGKFGVEGDWISNVSQNVQKSGFLVQIDGLLQKNEIFQNRYLLQFLHRKRLKW